MALKRCLFVVLAMPPLVVAVAWGRSYLPLTPQLVSPVMVGLWYWPPPPMGFGLRSFNGVVEVWHSRQGNAALPGSKLERFSFLGLKLNSEDSFYTVTPNGPQLCSHTDAVAMPYWFLQLVSLLPLGLGCRMRARAIPPGHCRKCGYDLRATPRRCPECGLAPLAPC